MRIQLVLGMLLCNTLWVFAEQVTVNAEITINIENDDFSQWNTRALITERKKLEWDIILETVGQVPCALLSALCGAGAIGICVEVARKEFPKEALIAILPCAAACPAFAAWYLDLANKKLFNRYLIEEINDQLALLANDKTMNCVEAV